MLLRPLHEFLRLHLPLSPRRWRVTSERERRLVQCNFSSSFGCALHPEPFSLLRNKTRPYHSGSSFSPLLWAGGLGEGKDAGCLGEGNDAEQPRIGVGLGGALLPPHGRRRERSLDNGILVNQIMGLSRWGYPTTTGRNPPVMQRDQRHRLRHIAGRGFGSGGIYSKSGSPMHCLGQGRVRMGVPPTASGAEKRVPQPPHVPTPEQFREQPWVPNYPKLLVSLQ